MIFVKMFGSYSTDDSGRTDVQHVAILGLGALAHALSSTDSARSDAILRDLTNALSSKLV